MRTNVSITIEAEQGDTQKDLWNGLQTALEQLRLSEIDRSACRFVRLPGRMALTYAGEIAEPALEAEETDPNTDDEEANRWS